VVVLALIGTGWLSARLGREEPGRAIVRNVVGGVLAMAVTYVVGRVIGSVD
jgi:VIT1/CCC1 family predicted Fe2+/Mn2+ transporter